MDQVKIKKAASNKSSTENSELKRKKKKIKRLQSEKTVLECLSPRGDGQIKTIIKVKNEITHIQGNDNAEKKKSKREQSTTEIIEHQLNHQITRKTQITDYKNTFTEEDPEKEVPKIIKVSEGRIELVEEEEDDDKSDDELNIMPELQHKIALGDKDFTQQSKGKATNLLVGKKEEQNLHDDSEFEDDKQQPIEDKYQKSVTLKLNEMGSQNLGNDDKKKRKEKNLPPKK